MGIRTWSDGILLFSGVLLTFAPLFRAQAQDVDVPGNLTMHDSTDPTVGNILKEGVRFLHNSGTNNTFLGSFAGNFTMSGGNNTGTGLSALQANTTGMSNTASGVGALQSNTTGNFNTATGRNAMVTNTTGSFNTASGVEALLGNTTGQDNTAHGLRALASNTTGSSNTATGSQALSNNTTAGGNTATGWGALAFNSTGAANNATGHSALHSNATGNYNVADGVNALGSNVTGDNSTAVGGEALFNNYSGGDNTAIGRRALYNQFIGSFNTALGSGADVFGVNLTNATAIGAGAIVNDSNKIRFGNSAVTVIEGEVPYTYTSDRNKKENFRGVDAETVLIKLRGLSVASWNYKGQDPKQFRHYGPVAQDFFAAFGQDAVGTIGTPTTITSGDLDGILMLATQALERRTVEQEKEIAELKARLEALERRSRDVANVSAGF